MPQKTKMTLTKGSVIDELGFSEAQKVAIKMKADVLNAILKIIKKRKYSQRDLQKILDQPQPRISELVNGKLSKMSLEKLIEYLSRLGGKSIIKISFGRAA